MEHLEKLIGLLESSGEGSLAIGLNKDGWLVSMEFGREAPDSPMAGGAAYGAGSTLAEALERSTKGL